MNESFPLWTCNIEPTAETAARAKPWTVGDKYLLKCEGSTSVVLDKNLQFAFPTPELTYILHPLEVAKIETNAVEIVVTGYKPGKTTLEWMEVSDGTSGFRVEKLEFEVGSVIPPGQPAQPAQNVNAFYMGYPLWMWVAIALAIVTPIIWTVWRVRRRVQIKRLVENLAASTSALRPYDQFSKDVRGLVRQYNYHADSKLAFEFLVKLNESFKTYLTRDFHLPALVWSPGTLTREIRRRDGKLFKDLLKDLKNLMLELNKAEQSKKVSPEDADQLKKHCMILSERIFKLREDKSNK